MGLERDWRQEEMLRGKVPKWNSREDESREDFPPKIRELLHQGYMLVLRSAASRARSAGNMEELARLCPPSLQAAQVMPTNEAEQAILLLPVPWMILQSVDPFLLS